MANPALEPGVEGEPTRAKDEDDQGGEEIGVGLLHNEDVWVGEEKVEVFEGFSMRRAESGQHEDDEGNGDDPRSKADHEKDAANGFDKAHLVGVKKGGGDVKVSKNLSCLRDVMEFV